MDYHICEYCGISIVRRNNLVRHIREKHSSTINVLKCSYCQRPFVRKSNLKEHYVRVHKLCEENVKNEMSNCKSTKMPYQQKEVLKPVFVMDPAYEDISSDEEFNDEIPVNSQSVTNMCEDIASDDECNLMDEMDYCMDSEFLSSINERADDIQCILDDIIATNSGLVDHEDPPVVAATEEEEEEAVQHDVDDDKEEEEVVQYDDNDQLINTETTTICLCLTRTVKTFKNGRTEETRNTSISHSENVNLNKVDLGAVALDILNEVPIQFSWPSIRVTKTL